MYAPPTHSGFTLVELMIVIAIVAITTTFAAPAFVDMIAASRMRSAASDLYASALLARSEAIKRNTNVDVVPVGGSWSGGWTVQYVDGGGSTVELEKHEALTNVTTTASASGNLTFRLDGRVSSAVRGVTFTATNSASVAARCVLVDASGRPGVKTDTDNDASNGCN